MSTSSDSVSVYEVNHFKFDPPLKGEWYRVARVVNYAIPPELAAEHANDIQSLRHLEKLDHAFRERLGRDEALRMCFIRRLKAHRGKITEKEEAFEWNEISLVILEALLNRATFEIEQKQLFVRKLRFIIGLKERKVALEEINDGLKESYCDLLLFCSKSERVKVMKTKVWNALKEKVDINVKGPDIIKE